MYSEQGFEALIRPLTGLVCHSLHTESNCIPGSPHCQAASAISRQMSRAFTVSITEPSRPRNEYSPPSQTAFMNSSVTRTELLLFWKNTELYASPLKLPS